MTGVRRVLFRSVIYEITVENDGNLTQKNIVVTDELTGESWTVAELKPGETSAVLRTAYVVTEADITAGRVRNVATATANSPDPDIAQPDVTPGESEVKTEEENSHITLSKTTVSVPANGSAYALGETVTYEIKAVNDGNLTQTFVTVADSLTGESWTVDRLAPGEEKTFTTSYTITEADVLAGTVRNIATAGEIGRAHV